MRCGCCNINFTYLKCRVMYYVKIVLVVILFLLEGMFALLMS